MQVYLKKQHHIAKPIGVVELIKAIEADQV